MLFDSGQKKVLKFSEDWRVDQEEYNARFTQRSFYALTDFLRANDFSTVIDLEDEEHHGLEVEKYFGYNNATKTIAYVEFDKKMCVEETSTSNEEDGKMN